MSWTGRGCKSRHATSSENASTIAYPRPISLFIRSMKANGINIARNQELQILVVFYMGDEGGISCDVTPPDMKKTPIITSITHIKIEPSHPLADEIRAYQAERTRKLARSGGSRKPTHFTIKPRKRRRRRR